MNNQKFSFCKYLFLPLLTMCFKLAIAHAELGDGNFESFDEYDFNKNDIHSGSLGSLQGFELSFRHGKQVNGNHCAEVIDFKWKNPKKKSCCQQTVFNEMTDCSNDPVVKNEQIKWRAGYVDGPIWHCWTLNPDKTKLIKAKFCQATE